MISGMIFDIKRFSIHDGPGIRSTVFLKGCPLRCLWCHNPESQDLAPELMLKPERCIGCKICLTVCPEDAIRERNGRLITNRDLCQACGCCVEACTAEARTLIGERIGAEELLARLLRDTDFYVESGGGITFSGGEPLMQPTFLFEMLRLCRTVGLHTAVDTCAFVHDTLIEEASKLADLFLFDLKVLDDDLHREATGVSNQQILRNLDWLLGIGARVFIRLPLIPRINDDDASIAAFIAYLSARPGVERIDLLPFHRIADHKYSGLEKTNYAAGIERQANERVRAIKEMMTDAGLPVWIGG